MPAPAIAVFNFPPLEHFAGRELEPSRIHHHIKLPAALGRSFQTGKMPRPGWSNPQQVIERSRKERTIRIRLQADSE